MGSLKRSWNDAIRTAGESKRIKWETKRKIKIIEINMKEKTCNFIEDVEEYNIRR